MIELSVRGVKISPCMFREGKILSIISDYLIQPFGPKKRMLEQVCVGQKDLHAQLFKACDSPESIFVVHLACRDHLPNGRNHLTKP